METILVYGDNGKANGPYYLGFRVSNMRYLIIMYPNPYSVY